MKIEGEQLPNKIKEFLERLFYLWDGEPFPNWMDTVIDPDDNRVEVEMMFDHKSCILYFIRDSGEWMLELDEYDSISLDEFRAEYQALFQMFFSIEPKKKKED